MNKELVEKLLNTKTEEEFLEVLILQDEEYEFHKELWDKKVIKHFLKLSNMSKDEFDKQFIQYPPIDDFDSTN